MSRPQPVFCVCTCTACNEGRHQACATGCLAASRATSSATPTVGGVALRAVCFGLASLWRRAFDGLTAPPHGAVGPSEISGSPDVRLARRLVARLLLHVTPEGHLPLSLSDAWAAAPSSRRPFGGTK